MVTRRGFLRCAGVLPIGASLVPSFLSRMDECLACAQTGLGAEAELIYAGKPLSYWLSGIASGNYDPGEEDLVEIGMFRHFGDAAIPGLIEAMDTNAWFTVSHELQSIPSPAGVQALAQALQHEQVRVRMGAVSALLHIASKNLNTRSDLRVSFTRALPALAEMVKTEEKPGPVWYATRLLRGYGPQIDSTFILPKVAECRNAGLWVSALPGRLNDFKEEEVVPILVERLEDANRFVRWAAAAALSHFEPDHQGIIPVFLDNVAHRHETCLIHYFNLDRILPRAMPGLIQIIKSDFPLVRIGVVRIMGQMNPEAVTPTITGMFDDKSDEIRQQAVYSLSRLNDAMAKPLLIRALQDRGHQVRAAARNCLKQRRRHCLAISCVPELQRLLEQGNSISQVSAALALGHLGHEARNALPSLRIKLEHEDPYVRLGAAIALARIEHDGEGLVEILSTGLNHPEEGIREEAIEVFLQLRPSGEAILPGIIEGLRNPGNYQQIPGEMLSMVAAMGPEAEPALPHLLGLLAVPWVGRDIMEVLPKIGPKAIGPLTELIQNGDPLAQHRSVEAIGLMGVEAEKAVPMLIQLLKNGSAGLRIKAAEALGNIGPRAAEAVPLLSGVLQDRDIALRLRAKEAIAKIQGEPVATDA